MTYDFAVFREDLKAAANSLADEDFDNLNIFANRIMGNSIFGEGGKPALVGFLLKDIAAMIGSLKIKALTTDFAKALTITKEYVRTLSQETETATFNEGKIWEQYSDFRNDLRKFWLLPPEERSYSVANKEFTHASFLWLIRYLGDHKDILLNSRNQFLKGLLNEMSRLFHAHGGGVWEIHALSLLTALDRCGDYAKFAFHESFQESVKSELFPYVDNIVSIFMESEMNVAHVDELLWELIRKWREYFIQFMDVLRLSVAPAYQPERGIEIPEETKEKLTKAITKSLGEEPKSRRSKARS